LKSRNTEFPEAKYYLILRKHEVLFRRMGDTFLSKRPTLRDGLFALLRMREKG
jgi:hypothetical protein